MTETMTIHRALAENKMLDARISKALSSLSVVVPNKHSNTKISGVPIDGFCKKAVEDYKSLRTLISRQNAIKRAITNSNAVTKVSIGGSEYTVAEAIDMKNRGVLFPLRLAEVLEQQYSKAKAEADRNNGDKLDQRSDEHIKNLYQGTDMKNMSEEIKKVRDAFITSQTVEVLDPVNAIAEAEALHAKLDTFMAEVDSALSVSNALTTITVEYETY